MGSEKWEEGGEDMILVEERSKEGKNREGKKDGDSRCWLQGQRIEEGGNSVKLLFVSFFSQYNLSNILHMCYNN